MSVRKFILSATAAAGIAMTTASGAGAETMAVGTDVGQRLVLAFDVNDEAAASWLPEGATRVAVGRGPYKGADLLLVLNDWALRADTEGKPLASSGDKGVVVAGFGIPQGADAPRLYVMRVYASDASADPYKVSVAARIARSNTVDRPAEGGAVHTESWTVAPETGGRLTVELTHDADTPRWSSGTTTPYSVREPGLHRVYNWSQMSEVVMSDAMQKALEGEISISTDIEELASAFDGSERLLAVLSVPTYYRDVFAPGS